MGNECCGLNGYDRFAMAETWNNGNRSDVLAHLEHSPAYVTADLFIRNSGISGIELDTIADRLRERSETNRANRMAERSRLSNYAMRSRDNDRR